MAKGDVVRVILDIGGGQITEQVIVADKAGRSVSFETNDKQNRVTVEVVGRAGTPARTVQMRADRVILIEEIPV